MVALAAVVESVTDFWHGDGAGTDVGDSGFGIGMGVLGALGRRKFNNGT